MRQPARRVKRAADTALVMVAIVLAGCNVTALAQVVHNSSTLMIGDVTVYIDGSVHNKGKLVNSGMVDLNGDWTSTGTYSGKGTLHLSGGDQEISHDSQTLHTLSVGAPGHKKIFGALEITSSLELHKGVVVVPPGSKLALREDVSISGGSGSSYVDGPLAMEGTGYKFFPLGKDGIYSPIILEDVRGDEPEYSIEVFHDAPQIHAGNGVINDQRYWKRVDLAGEFLGTPVSVIYDDATYADPFAIRVLAGSDWDAPFAVISDLDYAAAQQQVTTRAALRPNIIMLGEAGGSTRQSDFYFSTALSPRAANPENQRVKVFGSNLQAEDFRFEVFDRWGNMLYESRSLEQMASGGWDGRREGKDLASGAYPYRLVVLHKSGQKLERKGMITILH